MTPTEEGRARKSAGFDWYPPNCSKCRHVRVRKVPKPGGGRTCKRPCKVHGFEVAIHSVCDSWHGKNGDTLE